MEKRFILPLDGYPSASMLFTQLERVMERKEIAQLVEYVKINDGLHNPDMGGPRIFQLLAEACSRWDIKLFLDMKILDVSATLINILKKYPQAAIGILTISSQCSLKGIAALRQLLPNTKLAMVSVPTDISEAECMSRFGMMPEMKIYNDVSSIRQLYQARYGFETTEPVEPFDLVVCSYFELAFLHRNLPAKIGFLVPAIRDEWMLKNDEHQERKAGVRQAFDAGATFIVAGAQLTKGNPEKGISPEESCRLTMEQVKLSKPYLADIAKNKSPLEILQNCGGYYHAQKNKDGKHVGPLVAYAGKYSSSLGSKNYVGNEYFNFARAEERPYIRSYFARMIAEKIEEMKISVDVVMGAPMGGIVLAVAIGDKLSKRTVFAEKQIVVPADESKGRKEESDLIIARHELIPSQKVVLVEDVCNNFSTTAKIRDLITAKGAELVAIVCAFNRSGEESWENVPVISAHFIPTMQYRQDDPEVAPRISRKQICWTPKKDWDMLLALMNQEEEQCGQCNPKHPISDHWH